jgi:4'-phosphopantetheinyl transferase EntD
MKSFREMLPSDVVLATASDEGQDAPLLDGEAETVLNASPKRQRSFALGRDCARRALGDLGLDVCAILSGPRGEPLWPQGVTGSITHRSGFWAAAVAPSSVCLAIGIDAELNHPLPAPLREKVVGEASLPTPLTGIHWEAVVFSAKEATFKARRPEQISLFDFLGIELSLDPRRQTFQARLNEAEAWPLRTISGVFATAGTLILTAALIPRPPP